MSSFKLKVNIGAYAFEAEGDEAAVRPAFDVFMLEAAHKSSTSFKNESKKESVQSRESYDVLPKEDFGGEQGLASMDTFVAVKNPKNAFERNAAFVYYLQKHANVSRITLSHIYSCYKYVGHKPPLAFRQSIVDTSYKKQWIDTANVRDIKLTHKGEIFVEHELLP